MLSKLRVYQLKLSNFKLKLKNLIRRKSGIHYRRSYSQCGEDLIIRTIFDIIGVCSPSYLDIGAHHPSYLNNTYIFYQEGSRGVNVEPDLKLFSKFNTIRPSDLNLNFGIGKEAGNLDLYVMSTKTLNTFSAEEAQSYVDQGFKIESKVSVPIITINQLLDQYCKKVPDFLSVDVEGFDYDILNAMNFDLYRPAVICVETIVFSNTGLGKKRDEIEDLIVSKGYFKFADTYINSIFVDNGVWARRLEE
jgi:FkbM family methyltransferase